MNDQVEEIKSKIDIATIIGERIALKKAGKNFKANCPFHSEKTPSFNVSPDIQIFKCFGCGESGDVFTFLEKYDGMEFYEALKYLAERTGVKLIPRNTGQKTVRERIFEVNEIISRFYQFVLLKHPAGEKPLDYLYTQRGLKADTVKTFKIGFAPDDPFALKKYLIEKKGINQTDLENTGVFYKKDGGLFDRFRGRAVFPLYDHRGNLCGFSGRLMPWEKNQDLAKYINTPETPAYQKSQMLYGLNLVKNDVKKKDAVVIVEGELDMISSWQVGITNVVAIKGSALTQEHIKLLSRYTKNLSLALDSDFAGNEAARRGIVLAHNEGLNITVSNLGNYKDPDDMARKDHEGLKKAISEAVVVWDFLIDLIFEKYKGKIESSSSQIGRELVDVLSMISDEIVKAYYVNLVAKKLQIPADSVFKELDKKSKVKDEKSEILFTRKDETEGRRVMMEERLFKLIMESDPTMMVKEKYHKYLRIPLLQKIIQELTNYFKNEKEFDGRKFSAILPPELVEGYARILMKDEVDDEDNPRDSTKEIWILINEIETLDAREELKEVTKKLSEMAGNDENLELKKLNKKLTKLSEKIKVLEDNNHKGIILH